VRFDRALVATGARNRRIDAPGDRLPGVFDLRRIEDADRVREHAGSGARAAVVGMSFMGAEVAASLRQIGCEVDVVEPLETAMVRVLGPDVGRVVEAIHRDHGVRVHFGEALERFEGTARVEAVVTSRGRRIESDFAVVGVGVQPNVGLARDAGLPTPNGIVASPVLQTANPDVFAAGDVVLHEHPLFGRVRVEHHDNALKMGQAAARNMLREPVPFDDPHWFWSDQFDVNIQVAGVATSWDGVVVRGSVEDRSFSAFFLREGRVLSVVGLNRSRDVRRAMALVRAGARPDPAALRNEAVDLRTLAPARA
jgi:3-phenylpropionate/trans-cinnamate dioxygenase ferredoxin reductase subunit